MNQLRPFLGALALALPLGSPALAAQLEVHFINVGQAHAALVIGPDGTTVLIDGGDPGDGSGVVIPYLQAAGVTALDYTIATHYHSDHHGGLDEVVNGGFAPQIAFDRGNQNVPSNTQTSNYLAAVAGLRQTPNPGQTVSLGGGATMTFMVVAGSYSGGSINPFAGSQAENSASVGVLISYQNFDCWIGGDLTGGGSGTVDVETLVAPFVGEVEVYLANHHGSSTSSNQNWINALNPSLVVYSNGLDNPFGHPHTQTIARMNNPSATRVQWCTTAGDTTNSVGGFMAANGNIVVASNGNTFTATRSSGPEVVRFATHEGGIPSVVNGDMVITELLVDPQQASDAFGEWFELGSISDGLRDLAGVRVFADNDQFTLASHLLLSPGERLVFGDDGRESRSGSVYPDLAFPYQQFDLPNGSSFVSVREASNFLIDTVAYGGAGVQVTTGASAERIDVFGPANQGNFADALSEWVFGSDLGSPGEVNTNEPSCDGPNLYCVTAPNSAGPGATIGASGSFNVQANDLVLTVDGGPPNAFGLFFFGPNQIQSSFGDGFRCVGGQTQRLTLDQFDMGGSLARSFNYASPAGQTITPGQTANFQFWYRDGMAGMSGFNLSDAFSATFCSEPVTIQEGDAIVSEFMSNPAAVADADGEWFELVNKKSSALSLDGWTLEDDGGESHTISSFTLPPNGRAVFGRNDNLAANGGIVVDYVYGTDLSLDNGFDSISLRAPNGDVIDRIEWNAGFFPLAAGRSSTVDPSAEDFVGNDNSINWCLSSATIPGSSEQGTPGTANENCP